MENLDIREAIITIQEHVLEDMELCENDEERVEWILDLMDEFYSVNINMEESRHLLILAKKDLCNKNLVKQAVIL